MVLAMTFTAVIAGRGQPSATVPGAPGSGGHADRPRIEFVSTNLEFGAVATGQIVEHTFVFTNTGSRILEIQDVRPTCGCTIAGAWSRQVDPGKTGSIPVRYTPDKPGDVLKTVIVLCNDPIRTNVVLQLKGNIYELVEIQPSYVFFSANADSQTNQTRVVRIVNHMNEPLLLSNPECSNRTFQNVLKTIQPGKEYELQVTLVPPLNSGTTTVVITLKTSSTNLPAINITGVAAVQAPITASPSEITLAPGPLPSDLQSIVTIKNNCARPLILSEAVVNITGVAVRLREIQPGRQYSLTANFPAGFQIQRGAGVQVKMKTDNPEFPTLTVPIVQNQRLAVRLKAAENDPLELGK
jgi:hypothetical protein